MVPLCVRQRLQHSIVCGPDPELLKRFSLGCIDSTAEDNLLGDRRIRQQQDADPTADESRSHVVESIAFAPAVASSTDDRSTPTNLSLDASGNLINPTQSRIPGERAARNPVGRARVDPPEHARRARGFRRPAARCRPRGQAAARGADVRTRERLAHTAGAGVRAAWHGYNGATSPETAWERSSCPHHFQA